MFVVFENVLRFIYTKKNNVNDVEITLLILFKTKFKYRYISTHRNL